MNNNTIALVDERLDRAAELSLLKCGFHVIRLPASDRLGSAVASHPDMLLFYYKDRIITSADYCERAPYVFTDIRELSSSEIIFSDESFDEKYPKDAIFNALAVGEWLLCKADTVSPLLLDYARESGLEPISVKQGYPACTTLSFGRSAITADRGIAKALTKLGIRVTVIRDGGIELPPYEYGFIGGACGVYRDTVYFIGDLSTHPDAEAIRSAIEAEGFSVVSLCDGPLRDLGRIIFID